MLHPTYLCYTLELAGHISACAEPLLPGQEIAASLAPDQEAAAGKPKATKRPAVKQQTEAGADKEAKPKKPRAKTAYMVLHASHASLRCMLWAAVDSGKAAAHSCSVTEC